MYSIDLLPNGSFLIKRENSDESVSWIPVDPNNADYLQYLVDTDGGLPDTPSEAPKELM